MMSKNEKGLETGGGYFEKWSEKEETFERGPGVGWRGGY